MRDLSHFELAEVSGGTRGINFQVGSSEGTHISGTLHDLGEAAYMYGRVAPFSGIGAAGLIYHYLMAR
ncbi:hypothetical protein D7Y44_19180 [Stenotrophomonas maltophilia]|uniref:hypothetical protein n=1 Tax=Stenotrophomonas maltophilia TaxID=40324 RepID=UPI0015DF7993|nr:hypothetical protein [Stenotrophomonas maltophilia]MBA0281190.1 hypothetical protein [Stenotrophomonas maltophilia]MBA0343519.1 hypothetical protein [Stenotrophomonas maltophilia]MBA0359547.1 hypothetical protein [Stenotrophomonas maltophilia]MBA0520469.1 hypothetical protein [Stenotrophomonas maltophilia]MDT3485426.1 hypothetical protein [Stenotrophomonas maltophilia]